MPQEKKEKIETNEPIADFIEELKKSISEQPSEDKDGRNSEDEDIEETGESMARLYEKVRNLIEYKDDHLIKRYAIERILRRYLLIELRQQDISESFLNELSLAGYVERGDIGEKIKNEAKKAVSKYQKAVNLTSGFETRKWLLSIGACEIEEALFPSPARYALARAMYRTVKDKIVFASQKKSKNREIQIFIAVLRSLSKVDVISLNYYLLKIYLPDWFEKKTSQEKKLRLLPQLIGLSKTLRRQSNNPLAFKISVALRKHSVYFNILYEACLRNISKIDKIFADPETLKFSSQLAAEDVYDREMKKFWRRVKRSLMFLVITKIVLAAAVEYPFDRYIIGEVYYLPILINLLFPPIYLMALSFTVRRPSSSNSALIARGIEKIVYGSDNQEKEKIRIRDTESASDFALNVFFSLTFAISFGIVVWILLALRFNWLGILIFLFLFSVVSFFNALVRQPIRELLIARAREGIIGVLIDTLSIPFVRIGKWMSVNFSRVNVFMFLFDVIIEAPFKVMIRFLQEWAGFIRRKKEEMI